MKVKTYVRVGYDSKRRKSQVVSNAKPNNAPLTTSGGNVLPTVASALVLDIPDKMFTRAEAIIAEIVVPESLASIAADVKVVPVPETVV